MSNVRAASVTARAAGRTFCRTTAACENDEKNDTEQEAQLHPHWQSMEKRVVMRKLRLKGEGPQGRSRPPPTEEDMWLDADAYNLDRSKAGTRPKPWQKK